MGFEDEMQEWYEEGTDSDNKLDIGSIEFKRKNIITAVNVSFWKVVREYIFWVLGGKPENHWVGVNGDKDETR